MLHSCLQNVVQMREGPLSPKIVQHDEHSISIAVAHRLHQHGHRTLNENSLFFQSIRTSVMRIYFSSKKKEDDTPFWCLSG